MTEKDNVQLAKQAIAAINAHDIESYLKNLDESYTGESETLGSVHGREGARQMLMTMFQAFPDIHLEIEQILASGDHVVSRVIASGIHKGNFAGVAPTNKKVSFTAAMSSKCGKER
jgi:predicted ester cyclase